VLPCEQDLSGNIDKFMDENVPISDVVFFLGTNKSVFNSPDCAHELELSENYQISVFPMKGMDVTWQDMSSIGFSQDPGIEYSPEDFERVCEQLYEYTKKFYNEHSGLFKIKTTELQEAVKPSIMEKKTIDVLKWEDFYNILEHMVESEDLRLFHERNSSSLTNLVKQMQSGSLDDANFMIQVCQLYLHWFQSRG
jgi:hypothetical protein